jgi:hypothetical protein
MSGTETLSTTERAFQLAGLGCCQSLTDISRQLNREGFTMVDAHLRGCSIRAQLNKLLRDRREPDNDRGSRR